MAPWSRCDGGAAFRSSGPIRTPAVDCPERDRVAGITSVAVFQGHKAAAAVLSPDWRRRTCAMRSAPHTDASVGDWVHRYAADLVGAGRAGLSPQIQSNGGCRARPQFTRIERAGITRAQAARLSPISIPAGPAPSRKQQTLVGRGLVARAQGIVQTHAHSSLFLAAVWPEPPPRVVQLRRCVCPFKGDWKPFSVGTGYPWA